MCTTRKLCCLGAVLLIGTCFTLAQGQASLSKEQLKGSNAASITETLKSDQPTGARQGGEDCSTAVGITSLPFTDTGTTVGYADDYDPADDLDGCPYNPSSALDVVYVYTPGNDGAITIDLCNSSYDTKVFVYEGSCVDPPIRCDDDACGSAAGYTSKLENVEVSAFTNYYIVVDGYSGSSGDYEITVTDFIPPTGACCVDGVCVADNTEAECDGLGGDWYEGEECVTWVCPIVDCPEDALFAQPPSGPDDVWSFGTTEFDIGDGTNYLRYEKAEILPAEITDIHWWGAWLYNDGVAWSECTESDPTFEIYFYADNAGVPGAVVCGPYTVVVPGVATGILYSGAYEMYYFEVDPLTPPCNIGGTFWVSIQGLGDTTCWFMWLSSEIGDDSSWLEEDGVGEADDIDLSLCLTGMIVEEFGACCNELTGACTDNVSSFVCVEENELFVVDTLCADLVPECGERTGACCVDYAPGCIVTTRGLCLYAPADMNCDGIINFDDIDPFVTALVGAEGYYAEFPDCNYLNGDIDGNGIVNFDDIDPFVNLLVAGGPPSPMAGVWQGWGTICMADCDCILECPVGATIESEACGDDLNGGCNMNTPAFEPIECADVICGTIWADEGTRDLDWFELVLTEPMVVTWSAESEFAGVIGLLESNNPGSGDCADLTGYISPADYTSPCASATSVEVTLPAGSHWFVITNQTYYDLPCGTTNDYIAMIECAELPDGACCLSDGSCVEMNTIECAAAGGIYLGDETVCDPNPCTGCFHRIDLHDSYGDGWNGAAVAVFANSVEVAGSPFTIADGDEASYYFMADTGDLLSTTWTAGSYDSECSYELYDVNGSELCGEAAPPDGILESEGCVGNCEPPQEGACCLSDGTCQWIIEADCVTAGGIFLGVGTECDPNPCPPCFHRIDLYDSYGDGWNGASVNVYVNTVEVDGSPFTISSGSYASYYFFAFPGDSITTAWTSGSYDSECNYAIYGNTAFLCGEEAPPVGGLDCTAACDECIVECPVGGIPESEACGDDLNGGCNMDSPAYYTFEPIACEETVCGTIWADDGSRDTDWYELVLAAETLVTVSFESEFMGVVGLIEMNTPGSGQCDDMTGYIDPYVATFPCAADGFSICLPAGTHWIFASHQSFYGNPCGFQNDYVLSITCGPCPTGACCIDTVCYIYSELTCLGLGGIYMGDDTVCDPNPCLLGACCYEDGSCEVLNEADCATAGGTYQGDMTDCDPNPCPQPGACCFDDGSCVMSTTTGEAECVAAGGVYEGDDTVCDPNPCPQPPPINDECENAILVDTVSMFGNNQWATDDDTPVCGDMYATVRLGMWYALVGTGNEFTVTTCNEYTTVDTKIQVWCDCFYDFDGCVDGDDDDSTCSYSTLRSTVTFCTELGHTYYVLVGGYSTSSYGDFQVDFIEGDACAEPVDCTRLPGACCVGLDCYLYTEPECAIAGGDFLGEGTLCDPNPCAEGACCFDDGSCLLYTADDCALNGGVYEGGGTVCDPNPCPQPGDTCEMPLVLTVPADLPISTADTTCDRGDNYADTCLGSYDGAEDIIYEIVVTESVCVDISVTAGNIWTGWALHDTCPLDTTTCLYKAASSANPDVIEGVTLDAGTYYLQIDTFPSPYCDDFTLDITTCPTGACCVEGACVETDYLYECDALGGVWYEGEDCATFPCPGGCTHTLNMVDSYGDGWNGASVDVQVNSVSVPGSPFTVPSGGSSATATFLADTGDTIDCIWTSGSYDSECSYDITDGCANTICADGPSPTGVSCTGCCP